METIGSQVVGDLSVSSDTTYNNVLVNNVIVNENIIVRLYGIIKKDLTVKSGSTVYLHGRLQGNVINEGGVVYVFKPNGEVETF